MRGLCTVLAALTVMGLAVWAYHENYKTRQAISEVEHLQNRIGRMRERLGVLRAEWAYLNRPERLRELAAINFDTLDLMPLQPEQFGSIGQIAFPNQQGEAYADPRKAPLGAESAQ